MSIWAICFWVSWGDVEPSLIDFQRLVQQQLTQYPTSEELSIGKIKFKAFDLGGERDFWEHVGGIEIALAPSSFGQANTRITRRGSGGALAWVGDSGSIGRWLRQRGPSVLANADEAEPHVADQGGAEVVYRWVVVVLLMVDWGGVVFCGSMRVN
ncbi:hypothetical protein CMV_022567 [Castanea mollissima]|uniref:Uncharacterized protein n=1 Tax=Castanea mollissima TaxID=60419 RepID=A0A8J4VK54_9ROSI|nr:hypothetical protein CMV_022567 [Castanea mollissima]